MTTQQFNQANDIYGLSNRGFNTEAIALNTPFINQLAHLTVDLAKNLKAISFVMKDRVQNRGEIQKRGIRADEKSVLDITKLTPLIGYNGAKSLLEEIALFRADQFGYSNSDPSFASKNAEMLMAEYLLATSLCYVEIFMNGSVHEKFLATRSPVIVSAVTQTESKLNEYRSKLQIFSSHFESRQLPLIKINVKKNSYTATIPKTPTNFGLAVKVTPLFFITSLVNGISDALQEKMVKFTYITDNLTERELVSTTNIRILSQYYKQEMVQNMLQNIKTNIQRGYTHIPELGISANDETGVRALNLARIVKIEEVETFNQSYINVDLKVTLPAFISGVERCNHVEILKRIYHDITQGQPMNFPDVFQLKMGIVNFMQSQVAIGSTMKLRQLHDYMVLHPNIFTTYNMGRAVDYSQISGLLQEANQMQGQGGGNGFNLGLK